MFKRLLTFCAVAAMSLFSMAAVVEDFKKDWSTETGYPYYKVDDKATYVVEDGALKVTYPLNEDGTSAWSQYFIGDWMNTTSGYTYTIKFYAKASEACNVDVLLGTWGSAGKATGIAISTEWSEISCTVKEGVPSSQGNDVHVLIQGGRGTIEYQWATVSHDDSEEVEQEPEPEPFVVPEGEIDFTTLPVVGTLLDNNIGKSLDGGGVVYGSQSNGDNYTDVTDYKAVKFYGTPGAGLRLFVNRVGAGGVEPGKTEQRITIGEEGWGAMDVQEAMEATGADHCYLSSVKIAAGWQISGCVTPATINGITVIPAATTGIPQLPYEAEYNGAYTSCTITLTPTQGGTLSYTVNDGTEAISIENGTITLNYDAAIAEAGGCTYTVLVSETVDGEVVAQCTVEVSLIAPYQAVANGDYYIRNVATGQFLNGANAWGTKASLTTYGQLMTIAMVDGKYSIDTHFSNGGDKHYLGTSDNTFVDAAVAYHEIEELEDGTFTIKNDKYLAATDGIVNFNADEVTDAAKWEFVTRGEIMATIYDATENNPVDVTSLIFDPNFSRNNMYFDTAWEGDKPGKGGDNANLNAEKWGGNSQTFDSYQVINGLPNGTYKLSVQGYYRYNNTNDNTNDIAAAAHADGTETIYSVFYANEVSKPLASIADEESVELAGKMPFSQTEACAAFATGAYTNELQVIVREGTLKIGVKKLEHIGCDWTVWDNFQLTCIGDITVGLNAAKASATNDAIYNLAGQKVGAGFKGIVIKNGKKMIQK